MNTKIPPSGARGLLKIISWNIQQGGGSRTLPIASALVNGGFDIIVLSEFKNNENGRKIQEILSKAGFIFQINTKAFSDDNTVLIASKHAGEPKLYENADHNFTHNIATAQFSAFNLMGVYLPHKKKHNLLPFITSEISNSEVPFIVVGDYNIGHNFIRPKR